MYHSLGFLCKSKEELNSPEAINYISDGGLIATGMD